MRTIAAILIGGLATAALTSAALAQQDLGDMSDNPQPTQGNQAAPTVVTIAAAPPTQMEAFEQTPGVGITKRYSKVATLASDDGGTLNVYAVSLQNDSGATKQGVAVELLMRGGRAARVYVDSDEIDRLLDSLGQVEKVDRPQGSLESVETRYQTRGHLVFANVDDNGGRVVVIHGLQVAPVTGVVSTATVRLRAGRLAEVRQQIGAARDAAAKG